MFRMSYKSFFVPLMAFGLGAMTFLSSCNGNDSKTPEEKGAKVLKVGEKTYTIIGTDMVGVEVDHDDVSAFLYSGDISTQTYDDRRSVYFLKEGAVITELHTGNQANEVSSPRPIRQMLDYELNEFKAAKDFYESKMGKTVPTTQTVPPQPATPQAPKDTTVLKPN